MLRPANAASGRPSGGVPPSASPLPALFLVTTFDRGGAERILTRWATGLSREKYAVRVAALQGRSGAMAGDLTRAAIPAHDLRMACKGDLRVLPRLARLLCRERIRILITFLFHPTLLGRVVGWCCRVPIRVSSERSMTAGGGGCRLLGRWTAPLATHVVAVSERVAAHAARELRIPSDRLSTIVNGVDLDHFRPVRSSRDADAPVIGCTARLHGENDHATLLRAFAQVRERWASARLLLVGRGPEEPRLRALAHALGVAEHVSWVGEQADVFPYLREMTLYVQPSLAAGIPNSVLEAMAAGLPVVATDVGGTPEVVLDGQTGRLVAPGNPSALTEAMVAVLRDPRLAEEFGKAGRARVEARFGEDAMLREVEVLLDRLVETRLGLGFLPGSGWVRRRRK